MLVGCSGRKIDGFRFLVFLVVESTREIHLAVANSKNREFQNGLPLVSGNLGTKFSAVCPPLRSRAREGTACQAAADETKKAYCEEEQTKTKDRMTYGHGKRITYGDPILGWMNIHLPHLF